MQVGHVHGGVQMSVRATAPAAAALNIRDTAWSVQVCVCVGIDIHIDIYI